MFWKLHEMIMTAVNIVKDTKITDTTFNVNAVGKNE